MAERRARLLQDEGATFGGGAPAAALDQINRTATRGLVARAQPSTAAHCLLSRLSDTGKRVPSC